MHNSLRITECPHCNTAFRVSDAQLRAAKGAVRCGSCLEIFLANHHWLHDDNTDELDDWNDDDPDNMLAELEQLDRELESSIDDESWALKLLEEEQEEGQKASQKNSTSFSATSDNTGNEPTFVVLNEDGTDEHINESTIENSSDENNAISEKIIYDDPLNIGGNKLSNNQIPAVDDDLFADDEEFVREQAMFAGERFDNEFETEDSVPDFENDTQPLPQTRKKSFPEWIGGLVIVIAIALLIGQYIYRHAGELSQNAEWRWLAESTCPILQCDVPEWSDLKAIQHDNLVVRSHPQQRDALLINVRLINNSTFSQAFPLMELRFSDINGNEIASRRFKPEEYLAGELSGLKKMPVRQAIQIELAIVDPGSQAVNYQLGLLPNN